MPVHIGTKTENNGVVVEESKRSTQHLMTNDPDKVWPEGILPYRTDASVGNNIIIYVTNKYSMHRVNKCS